MRLDHLLSKEESKGLVYCLVIRCNKEGPTEWEDTLVQDNLIFLVAMRIGETPVPIPNTMVKTYTADGTALETVWESRWPPVLKK